MNRLGKALLLLCITAGLIMGYTAAGVSSKSTTANKFNLASLLGYPSKFDGKTVYEEAVEAVASRHKDLADPAAQKKFRQDWDASRFTNGELNSEDGTDKAIREMLQSLGQRYDYAFDKEATKAEKEQVDSTLVGIGMTVKLKDQESLLKPLAKNATRAEAEKAMKIGKGHELTVENAVEGAPAEKFLKKGDEVIKVDGKDLDGMILKEAVSLVRGKEGTVVEITVRRTAADGSTSELTYKITRALVEIKVVHTKDLGDGITYVKLDHFMSKNGLKEFRDALTIAAKGKGLVLDLRGNPGGELNQVLTMGAYMLQEGTLLETHQREGDRIDTHIVAVRKEFIMRMDPSKSDPSQVEVSLSKRPQLIIPEDMPIVVLVDEHSASASEILSGLLQKAKRAIIVGKTTVGKGVGQHVIDLSFDRRLHVTSFEFLPGGKAMDWVGIVPDVQVEQLKDKGKTDKQLESATAQVKQGITDATARNTNATELEKKNKEEFKKALEERKNKK
jgi:carboxyl-terminal processing protease